MKTSCDIHRSFFTGRYSIEFSAEIPTPKHALTDIADSLISILPTQFLSDDKVLDLKGRDPQRQIDPALNADLRPRGEEILFISGEVLPLEDEEKLPQPFKLSILTKFDQFVGLKQISHQIMVVREGSLPSDFPLGELGRAAPIELNYIRFGIELFTPSFFGILGFAPEVTQSLLIQADSNSVKITIECEKLRSKENLPMIQDDWINRINHAIEKAISFQVIANYRSAVL